MANHVENYITIKNLNDEAKKEIIRIFKVQPGTYNEVHTTELISGIFDKPEYTEGDYDREWVIDNCGAKWFFGSVEDEFEDEIIIRIVSAWDPINPLLEIFTQRLVKICENVVVESIFEDEAYNFAGVFYGSKEYTDEEYIAIEEWDIERFWTGEEEDAEYQSEFFHTLQQMLDYERQAHQSVKNETE